MHSAKDHGDISDSSLGGVGGTGQDGATPAMGHGTEPSVPAALQDVARSPWSYLWSPRKPSNP